MKIMKTKTIMMVTATIIAMVIIYGLQYSATKFATKETPKVDTNSDKYKMQISH